MRTHTLSRILADQRGIALPMAMMIVLILSALMVAFSVLGASEPTLAANQQRVAQARAIAESGLERALWALNNPGDASGIPGDDHGILPDPKGPVPAPYDGSSFIPASVAGVIGGFRVTVSASKNPDETVIPNERKILVDGWVPNDTAPARVKQRIQVTVTKIRFLGAPVALAVRGDLNLGGHSLIDSSRDTSCGEKGGTWSKDETHREGSAEVCNYAGGCDNHDDVPTPVVYNPNDPTTLKGDIVTGVPNSIFDTFTYSPDEINMFKAMAKAQGTYYPTPAGGTVTFNASNKIPNGLIFVDITSGNDITATTPASDFNASLKISGNAGASNDGIFRGWIIVNGSARIDGQFVMRGLLYVQNDLTYLGTGNGKIVGAAISQNLLDLKSTTIAKWESDSDTLGNSTIVYNCAYARTGDNKVSQSFTIKLGTYKGVAG